MINEAFYHPEARVFRAATGGAYNLVGAYGQMVKGSSFPATGAIPIPTGKTGLIYSDGVIVRGVGTKFITQTDVQVGDWLYAQNVVRRVKSVESDTLLTLDQEFPADIDVGAAIIPLVCKPQEYKMIYAKNVHTANAATLQEAPFAAGNTYLGGGAPITYDAGSGQIEFSLHK